MRPPSCILPPEQAAEHTAERRDQHSSMLALVRQYATDLAAMKDRHAQELAELARAHHQQVEALMAAADASPKH